MDDIRIAALDELGKGFIPTQYLPSGQGEHYLRNIQSAKPAENWRKLTAAEIEALIGSGNAADSWDNVLVAEGFAAQQVRNCQFFGLVRIGRTDNKCIAAGELRMSVGLTGSRIIACDIGDNAAIHNVRYLAHYIVGDETLLLNIDAMLTTGAAAFGNGIVKDGQDQSQRISIDLINEAGGRGVCPFEGMTAADAFLWAKYRGDGDLMKRLGALTQESFDSRRGFYGTVGRRCVIANCRSICDVKVGPGARIMGADKLENLAIDSTADEPVEIGAGVELVDGIVSRGCRISGGAKAMRFVMGQSSQLKLGARLIHTYLGDNSTIACCEVLNNLIFPAHEQHHNNSFLIASLIGGQSNIAAGATIGSNHNSRANDGEVHAGRGFWPGLCVSLKHNCKFASFALLAKGDFPAELNIRLPFALVVNDVREDRLEVMPAYWWLYNMYALARNSWKFRQRDKRKDPLQKVEFDFLAPDTAEEMFTARALLEEWTAKASLRHGGQKADSTIEDLRALGRQLLQGPADKIAGLEVIGEGMENSSRPTVILKAQAGYRAYGQMLLYYAVKNLLAYMRDNPQATRQSMADALAGPRQQSWINLGGQLVAEGDLETLKADIREGRLGKWDDVHARYEELWQKYPIDKCRHALACLLDLVGAKALTAQVWQDALTQALAIAQQVADQTLASRKKDFDNPFRQMVFDTPAEMTAVCGELESNSFIQQVRKESEDFAASADEVLKRG